MLFNSPEFLFLFLPITLLAFRQASRHSASALKCVLLVASVIFYAYWHPGFVPLLTASVLANYALGRQLAKTRSRGLLVLAVAGNLALLVYFKYAGFFVDNLNALTGAQFALGAIVLPLGISFITFEQIAFVVDTYRGQVRDRRLVDYALFVTFFPQLIAGPIFHHRDMCPQFARFERGYLANADQVARGLFLLTLGLFKKVVIADSLAGWVDPVFANPEAAGLFDAWVASISYTLQLYFDFSAYSEMAMGLALFFGITMPINFNSPYKSTNISDFWRRWHISLGAFLREYLYVPLGGNRHGALRMMVALFTVMLLGGLWHGAGWNFVLWGALHGVFLVLHAAWRRGPWSLPPLLAVALTFMAVSTAWVVFRAQSLSDAWLLWQTMLGVNGLTIPHALVSVFGTSAPVIYVQSSFFSGIEPLVLVVLLVAVFTTPNVHDLLREFRPGLKSGLRTWCAGSAAIALLGAPTSFIYWQF